MTCSIEIHLKALYRPQDNEGAERMNCTVKNGIRTFLIQAVLSHGSERSSSTMIVNACSWVDSSACSKTPEEVLTGLEWSFRHLWISGCKAWARVPYKMQKSIGCESNVWCCSVMSMA